MLHHPAVPTLRQVFSEDEVQAVTNAKPAEHSSSSLLANRWKPSRAASISEPLPFEEFSATLLAMAGHDLRQPLQLIVGAHDRLARTLRGSEHRKELARAGDATAQLANMLGQIVEALRLRERSDDELHRPVPLRPILDGLAVEFAEPARLKGIRLRVTSVGGAAFTHPVLFSGMLRNLIRNAIDYTPPGGRVFITSRRCDSEQRLEVRDTGVGMRANVLSTIFQAFERNDETRENGLGLGLFIVKRAADLLGHRIEVRSAPGRGSSFAIVADAASRSAAA